MPQDKIQTGRAIIHFPYHSATTGRTYNNILLGRQRNNQKYSLPGGTKSSRDRDTLDTALRELEEEMSLVGDRSTARFVFSFEGYTRVHDIYLIRATGKLKIQLAELDGIGFFDAGRHNQIPRDRMERHVPALIQHYYGTPRQSRRCSDIKIPGYYFVDSTDSRLIDWCTAKDEF